MFSVQQLAQARDTKHLKVVFITLIKHVIKNVQSSIKTIDTDCVPHVIISHLH